MNINLIIGLGVLLLTTLIYTGIHNEIGSIDILNNFFSIPYSILGFSLSFFLGTKINGLSQVEIFYLLLGVIFIILATILEKEMKNAYILKSSSKLRCIIMSIFWMMLLMTTLPIMYHLNDTGKTNLENGGDINVKINK